MYLVLDCQIDPPSASTLLPRSESYPCDLNFLVQRSLSGDIQGNPSHAPGNLVSRLQQIHGMTKKKIYSAKPTRRPFFKDEPVSVRDPLLPTIETSVSIPSSSRVP